MKTSFETNKTLIVMKYLPYSFFIQQNVTPLKFPVLSLKKRKVTYLPKLLANLTSEQRS